MKKYIIYGLAVLLSVTITSCSDILDVDPVDSFTDAAVWGDLALSESYLNSCYSRIKAGAEKGSRFDSFSEDIYQMHTYGTENVRQGYLSPDNSSFGWEQDMWNPWDYYYGCIKEVNLFLQHINSVPAPTSEDIEWRNELRGQGYFLRAYFYNQLFFFYGRIPIITKVYALDTKEYNETRASLDDVANFIVTDCDSAAALLPLEYSDASDFGRATQGAALTLKGRTLLFDASPLCDDHYPTKAKWERASEANKAVIDLNYYSLPSVSNADDYAALFLNSKNPEIIFEKMYDTKWVAGSNNVFLHQAPSGTGNGFGGWGTLQPTNNLVNKFQMSDGTDYVPGASNVYPWANRDLRLYATVFLDGDEWGYGDDHRQVEFFVAGESGVNPGKDSREGPAWWNSTQTGFGMKKFLNPKWDAYGTTANTTPWIFMRLAEVYLNYAECQMELGFTDEALKYINLVRERALMPKAKGVNLRKEYEYEREIELVFEEQRWFDIRRWKQAEDIYKIPLEGMDIKLFKDGSKTYEVKPEPVETRTFYAPKNYWMPVPRSELRKAPKLDALPYE
ncbi:MAG: RagB/SusD family nutrient uptake outer membrane protein [Bacteroidota bacterium]|nr:RagB/SusD family nutrient uptake outer membrane protein [Bacteroidota bacterium]